MFPWCSHCSLSRRQSQSAKSLSLLERIDGCPSAAASRRRGWPDAPKRRFNKRAFVSLVEAHGSSMRIPSHPCRRNHAPQSQPIVNAISPRSRMPSRLVSQPNDASTLLDGVAKQLSDSVKRPAPLVLTANGMLVDVSVSKWTTGGKVRAELTSVGNAANNKQAKRKIEASLIRHAPYFSLQFYFVPSIGTSCSGRLDLNFSASSSRR